LAILRVQGNARGTGGGNPLTVINVALASNPTAGNLLILVSGAGGSISSISGGGVTTWTLQVADTNREIWAGLVDAAPSVNIVVNYTASGWTYGVVDVCEYSGLASSSWLDKTASFTGTYTNAGSSRQTGTTANTTQNDELWIGVMGGAGSTGTLDTPQNGFTLLDGASTVWSVAYLEKIVSATGAAYSGATVVTSALNLGGAIATFKMASTYSPKTRSGLVNTMTTLLNSKILFS
jgi:hypothetical protein